MEECKEQQAILPSSTNGYELRCAGSSVTAGSSASLLYLINSSKSPVQFNGGYNTDPLMNLFGPGKTAEVLCLICRKVSCNPEILSWILCKSIWDLASETSISFMDIGLPLPNL